MRPALLAALALQLGACGFIGEGDWQTLVDPDGDGLPRRGYHTAGEPWDCDDDDPDPFVSSPRSWHADADADGFGLGDPAEAVEACEAPEGYVADNRDCDDARADVHPQAPEVCDGVDNNCNDVTDEGLTAFLYPDADGDGFGDRAAQGEQACASMGYVSNNLDCDDVNPLVHPDAEEVCDGIDNNCVDGTDEGLDSVTFYEDQDADGFGDTTGRVQVACAAPPGFVTRAGDCADDDSSRHPEAEEVCDEVDNDCNGLVDDGLPTRTWFVDTDGDGFGDPSAGGLATCAEPPGRVTNATDCDDEDNTRYPGAPEICDGRTNPCDGARFEAEHDDDSDGYVACDASLHRWRGPDLRGAGPDFLDCAPDDPESFPNAIERCDGLDNDCDGDIDEDLPVDPWFVDADRDGYGGGDPQVACRAPVQDGLRFVTIGDDCDDALATVFPEAPERCDGLDNDCDGVLPQDETDVDGDGYVACVIPAGGWLGDDAVLGGRDCDDDDDAQFPGNPEVCDGKDNDCALGVDNGLNNRAFFVDVDGDGFGDAFSEPVISCQSALDGRAPNATDCDDDDDAVHPGAAEACDGLDWDCDGDGYDNDAEDAWDYYWDRDGDLHGNPDEHFTSCSLIPPPGSVRNDTDCDDTDPQRNPALIEVCNNKDTDCDGAVDDNPIDGTWYADADGDGYGDPSDRKCDAESGYIDRALDCDDDDPAIRPGAIEVSDGVDNDCDGGVDGSGMGNAVVIDGRPGAPGGFGAGISLAGGGRLLVSAPDEGGGAGVVYLFEPPFRAGAAPDLARTAFVGRSGARLTVAGDNGVDLTGDGKEDYVLLDQAGNGTVLVVPGPVGAGEVDPYDTAWTIPGSATHPILRVEPVESVTADPWADLLVSTRFQNASAAFDCAPPTWRGSVSLFDGPIGEDRAIDDRFAWLNGNVGTAGLHVLGKAGDLDADGFLDLAFGSPLSDDPGGASGICKSGGRTEIVLGPVAPGEMTVQLGLFGGSNHILIVGFSEQSGTAVDISSDLDGDGRADLLIGASYNPHAGYGDADRRGRVFVIPGARLFPPDGAPMSGVRHLGAEIASTYRDDNTFQFFGRRFALGDVDGDSVPDLIVEKPGSYASYLFHGPVVRSGLVPLTGAARYWHEPSHAISRSVVVSNPTGPGAVAHGVPASAAGVGRVYIFPGEDLF